MLVTFGWQGKEKGASTYIEGLSCHDFEGSRCGPTASNPERLKLVTQFTVK